MHRAAGRGGREATGEAAALIQARATMTVKRAWGQRGQEKEFKKGNRAHRASEREGEARRASMGMRELLRDGRIRQKGSVTTPSGKCRNGGWQRSGLSQRADSWDPVGQKQPVWHLLGHRPVSRASQ